MADNKEYITQQEPMGAIQISEDVVASIATAAAMEVEGVGGMLSGNVIWWAARKWLQRVCVLTRTMQW